MRVAAGVLDPKTLIGDHLVGVAVGWLVRRDERRPIAYFLRFGSGAEVMAAVTNDGTIEFVVGSPRSHLGTLESDTVEFEAVETRRAIALFIDRTIVGVDRVWWLGGGGTGLRLRGNDGGLVITPDEVHGRCDVTILDGDIDESWGHEPIA
jgi:hypothetical protein